MENLTELDGMEININNDFDISNGIGRRGKRCPIVRGISYFSVNK